MPTSCNFWIARMTVRTSPRSKPLVETALLERWLALICHSFFVFFKARVAVARPVRYSKDRFCRCPFLQLVCGFSAPFHALRSCHCMLACIWSFSGVHAGLDVCVCVPYWNNLQAGHQLLVQIACRSAGLVWGNAAHALKHFAAQAPYRRRPSFGVVSARELGG